MLLTILLLTMVLPPAMREMALCPWIATTPTLDPADKVCACCRYVEDVLEEDGMELVVVTAFKAYRSLPDRDG